MRGLIPPLQIKEVETNAPKIKTELESNTSYKS